MISTEHFNQVGLDILARKLGVDEVKRGPLSQFYYVEVEEKWSRYFVSGVQRKRLYSPSLRVRIGDQWYNFIVPIITKKFSDKGLLSSRNGEELDEEKMVGTAKKMISCIKTC